MNSTVKCPTCNKAFVENISCVMHFLRVGGGGRGKGCSSTYRWFSLVTFEVGILKVDI